MEAELYLDIFAQLADVHRLLDDLENAAGIEVMTENPLEWDVVDVEVDFGTDTTEAFIGIMRRHRRIIDEVDVLPIHDDVSDDEHYFDEFGDDFAERVAAVADEERADCEKAIREGHF